MSRCVSHQQTRSTLLLLLDAVELHRRRQAERIKKIHVWDKGCNGGTIRCDNIQQAKNLLTIVKKSEDTNIEVDLFVGDVKKQGWAALGKLAELHGEGDDWTRTFDLVSKRDDMLAADRGDLRKIWDAMGSGEFGNSWAVTRGTRASNFFCKKFHKSNNNIEWTRLVEVLDMSEKQWDEYKSEDDSEYSETEEEDRESLSGDSSYEP